VTVEAGKATAPIELHLIPDGVVAGKVVDSDGDPVRRAAVEAQQYAYAGGKKQLRTLRGVQTDDRGEYRLFHLPPGTYWLHVQPSSRRNQAGRPLSGRVEWQNVPPQTGLTAAYYPGSPDVAHATELQVAPGAELDGIDVRVTPERLYSIRGRVGTPDNGSNFSVFAQSLSPSEGRPNGFPMRMESDNNSAFRYELSGIPPGKYAVIGQQFSNQPQPGRPAIDMPRQYARQLVEIVDRDVDNIDLTFERGAIIRGVVKGEGSAPAKDVVNINLTPSDSSLMMYGMMFGGGARVEADGTFKLETAPGVYHVRVNGRQLYLKTLLVGKEAVPDRKIDTARLSGDVTLVVSNDFGKVEGTVVDEAGKPVFNANVTLIPDQRQDDWQQQFRSALTKADGKFSVAAVQPGEYRAYAWLGVEQGAPQDAEFRKPFEERAVVVKVEPNGKQTVDLKVIQLSK
jgi:Carboxypeptidase regulatory-like domain